jgi:hypothetical protein
MWTSHDKPTAAQILEKLIADQARPHDLSAKPEPGVYALFVTPRGVLRGITEPGSAALYIGSSSNLAQREFDTHFAAARPASRRCAGRSARCSGTS